MNRTRPAFSPRSLCLSLAVAVIVAAGAGTTEQVLACGFCITPSGLTAIHPESLNVAVAIRRDIESGLLKPSPAIPESKAHRHFRDQQTGRILAERLFLRKGFELLLIEDGSHYRIEGQRESDLRRDMPSSIRWVTGRDVLLALLERKLDLDLAVERGLVILETTAEEARSSGK